MADVKKIRVYEVSSEEGPAKFRSGSPGSVKPFREIEVRAGEDYKAIIDDLAREDEAKQDPASDSAKASGEHDDWETACRDGLDIDLGNEDGPIAIAIRLPKHDKYNQLVFRDDPIIEQKTNPRTGEKFIASEHRHTAGGNRWASFVCKPKETKGGKLAKCIRDLPDDPFGAHKGAMRVPFSYNIVDERLKFATWVLPDHAHVMKVQKRSKAAMTTHGGVHPYSSYYLTIDL